MKAIIFLSSYDLHNYYEFYSEDQSLTKSKVGTASPTPNPTLSPINIINIIKHSQYLINKEIEKKRMDYLSPTEVEGGFIPHSTLYLKPTKRFAVWS